MAREAMEYDVVIVGAGPAGLSAAIKLKQLDPNLNVCILEKGSEVGAHILSGNVFETKALDELIPNWKNEGAPVKTKVSKKKTPSPRPPAVPPMSDLKNMESQLSLEKKS